MNNLTLLHPGHSLSVFASPIREKHTSVFLFFGVALIISLFKSIVTLYQPLVFLFAVNCLLRCFINLCATRNLFPLGFLHIMLCLKRVTMNIYLQ